MLLRPPGCKSQALLVEPAIIVRQQHRLPYYRPLPQVFASSKNIVVVICNPLINFFVKCYVSIVSGKEAKALEPYSVTHLKTITSFYQKLLSLMLLKKKCFDTNNHTMKKKVLVYIPVYLSVALFCVCLLLHLFPVKHLRTVQTMPPDRIFQVHPETDIIISQLHHFFY